MSVENKKNDKEGQGQDKAGQENKAKPNEQPGMQQTSGQRGGQQDRMMNDRWGGEHTREIRDAVTDAGSRLRTAAEHAMPAAREQWERMQNNVSERAESLEESVGNYVRERPINSLLIAAGVGLVFGLFFFRR